ncbi:hypothetical protein chiPu_0014354 [Chiloscyllium punctatum]|uniref:Uncharacterized protein n=1 Tax=Chiloscyllium punctatum TaxID=137246 RepID=A0A401SZR0_CHIPU|nr:hypothetical protein [Chiloscyllium punctatum]
MAPGLGELVPSDMDFSAIGGVVVFFCSAKACLELQIGSSNQITYQDLSVSLYSLFIQHWILLAFECY